jgi:hypothetical protein
MDIEFIRDLIRSKRYSTIEHSELRKKKRVIAEEDIQSAILGGEIVKEYPNRNPLPRCVIRSMETTYQPLEVVCDVDEQSGWLTIVSVMRSKSRRRSRR